MKEESDLMTKLARAEQAEADTAERRRKRDQQQGDRRAAAERAALVTRIAETDGSGK